jgi:iron complex outermembrane receptor protein
VWDPTVFGSTARAYDNSPPNYCYAADGDNNAAGISITRLQDNGLPAPTVPTLGVTTTGTPSSCRERFVEARQWSDWSGRAGLRWNVTDDTNLFATYSRGYKAGAIRIGGFEVDVDSKPETLNAYELGLKTELLDRKLRLNTAAYYYDYMDYQIPLTRVDEANPGRTITDYFNIPKLESYGLEVETTWLVTDALMLNINYGFIGGAIKSDLLLSDALDPQGTIALAEGDTCYYLVAGQPPTTTRPNASSTCYQNAKGSPLNNSPEHKASFNATYTWQWSPGSFSLSGSYNWRAAISTQLIDRDYYKTDAYGTASARAIWNDADGRYSVIARVDNLLNDDTYNSVSATSLNGEIVKQYSFNPPRTIGLDFQFRFGSEKR